MFPKDFYTVHNRVSELLRQRREELRHLESEARVKKSAEDFNKAVKKYSNLVIDNGNYVFRVCREPVELIEESKALKHCVSSYDYRVAAGTCLIFFIRSSKEPSIPLYTMEYGVSSKSIVQLRGFSNKQAPASVYKFVENCLTQIKLLSVAG